MTQDEIVVIRLRFFAMFGFRLTCQDSTIEAAFEYVEEMTDRNQEQRFNTALADLYQWMVENA